MRICSGLTSTRSGPSEVAFFSWTCPTLVSARPSRTCAASTTASPTHLAVSASTGCSYTAAGEPAWMIRPSRMMAIRSAIDIASPWSCVTSRAEAPEARSATTTASRVSARRDASREENGSSSSSRDGRGASARARATRCCCPPESSRGGRCRTRGSSPTSSSSSSTRSCLRRAVRGRPKTMFADTSRCGNSAPSCGTYPTRRRCGETNTSSPHTVPSPSAIVPESGRSKPATRRSRVVLPQPEAPSTAVSWPSSTLRSTPSSTVSAPKDLRRSRTLRAVICWSAPVLVG